MYVCICNAVTEREIARAIERGAHTLAQLTETLGVGTGCGKCLDAAASFLASHPPPAAVAEPPA